MTQHVSEHDHDHDHGEHHDDDAHDDHDHDQHDRARRPQEDWSSEEYVTHWIGRQEDRAAERRRQFVLIRSMITRHYDDEFTYLNLGAGPGGLDAVLLEHFLGAQATLVDSSLPMLTAARQRLERFGDRVEYVQANLGTPDWLGAVSGPFDFVVSTIAIHNLWDPRRIRELYRETFSVLGHGGLFLNLDYLRPPRPSLVELGPWAARDPEAGLSRGGGNPRMPGTLLEQIGWLQEAGFPCVEVVWKNLNTALLCGLRDHLHIPEDDDDDHEHEHGHEGGHAHDH